MTMAAHVPADLYVIAIVAGQRIAIEAIDVASIVDLAAIVPVPLAPPHVLGLCALRSHIVTVIDIAAVLGQPHETVSRRAIIMHIDNHHYALVVTSVEQVEPGSETVQPIDASVGGDWARGVTGRVQTESGTALVLNPRLVAGMSTAA